MATDMLATAWPLDEETTVRTEPAPAFGAQHHARAAVVMLAIVFYASLFPFRFVHLTPIELAARLQAAMAQHPLEIDDFLANVLLFAPLGYLLLGARRADQTGREGSFTDALCVLAAVGVTSVLLELTQAFFPPRTPYVLDVLAQWLGGCVGIAAWQCCGRHLTERCRRAWTSGDLRDQAGLLFVVYVLGLTLIHLLPFNLNVAMAGRELDRGVSRVLDGELPAGGALRHGWDIVYFVPAGLLAAFVTRRTGRRHTEWRRALVLGIAAVILVKIADPFVHGRHFDLFEILTGIAAFGVGWFMGRRLRRQGRTMLPGLSPGAAIGSILLGAGWIAGAMYLLHGDLVDFTNDASLVSQRLSRMNWMPLAELDNQAYLLAVRDNARQALLFLVGGALLARALSRRLGAYQGVPAAAVGLTVAFALAVVPALLPSLPSITALLVQTAASWLGFMLFQGFVPSQRVELQVVRRRRRSRVIETSTEPVLATA